MDWNTRVINEFRANNGMVGNQFSGMSLLLLTTVGAKSGKEYITPLVYSKENDKYVIAASKGGAPSNPDWYYNLLKNPVATIEVGTEKIKVKANIVEGKERTRLYDQHALKYPGFVDYQKATSRVIPVFVLDEIT